MQSIHTGGEILIWCKAKLSGLTTNLFDCFIRYTDKFQCISPEVPCSISLSNIQYFGKQFYDIRKYLDKERDDQTCQECSASFFLWASQTEMESFYQS